MASLHVFDAMLWCHERVWVVPGVRSPAFRRLGPAEAGTPNRLFTESNLSASWRVHRGSVVAIGAAPNQPPAPETPIPGCCVAARNGLGCTSGTILQGPSTFPPAHRRDAAVPRRPLR